MRHQQVLAQRMEPFEKWSTSDSESPCSIHCPSNQRTRTQEQPSEQDSKTLRHSVSLPLHWMQRHPVEPRLLGQRTQRLPLPVRRSAAARLVRTIQRRCQPLSRHPEYRLQHWMRRVLPRAQWLQAPRHPLMQRRQWVTIAASLKSPSCRLTRFANPQTAMRAPRSLLTTAELGFPIRFRRA